MGVGPDSLEGWLLSSLQILKGFHSTQEMISYYLWGWSSWGEVGEESKLGADCSIIKLSSECVSVQNLECFILSTKSGRITDRTLEVLGGGYLKLELPGFET